jgi:serine/threonine-protein kinase
MIRKDGAIKLMDFGIARFLEESQMTITGALVGSPAFMSPEQAMEHALDGRSDLFSVGTVLFNLVTGSLPYQGGNPSVILRNIIDGNRPRVLEVAPEASPSFADAIERLLQTDPSLRFQNAEELKECLLNCLEESSLSPDDERFHIARLRNDPRAYVSDLETHLGTVLLDSGRARIDAGDYLGALRQFNRLLALDPENATVLELVQGLHARPLATDSGNSLRWSLLGAAGVLLSLLCGALYLVLRPDPASGPASEPIPPPEIGMSRVQQPQIEQWLRPSEENPTAAPETVPPTEELASAGAVSREQARRAGQRLAEARGGIHMEPSLSQPSMAAQLAMQGSLPDEKATLRVILDTATWAKIYIDGEERGMTGRKPIMVSPGQHVLRVRNDFSEVHEEQITVAPGEHLTIDGIQLRPLPAQVVVASSIPGSCKVRLDGTGIGTVASLGSRFSLPDPRNVHNLVFECADGNRSMSVGPVQAGSTIHVPGSP